MIQTTPQLVTFDGEARSGKGTIVQATKDYVRDSLHKKVMLIDRGQTFRVLVVAATRAGVDLDNTEALDAFLNDKKNVAECTQFVKDVYHMDRDERDALIYTNEVSANSAKVGARPSSQVFVANLTKKWLYDAGQEGYEVVLIDGRALKAIASEMDDEGLCEYRLGLYFICDAQVGARRTLGFAGTPYDDLTNEERTSVDELVAQIVERNERDQKRATEPLIRPADAPVCVLPDMAPAANADSNMPMLIIDTSAELSKKAMSQPVAELVGKYL